MSALRFSNQELSPNVHRIFEQFFPSEESFKSINAKKLGPLPPVNIQESDAEYLLEMAVPGFLKEDFKIELHGQTLKIYSETSAEKEEKSDNKKYTRKEFSFRNFERSFSLPKNTQMDALHAEYINGVLSLHIPKVVEQPSKEPKLIPIA